MTVEPQHQRGSSGKQQTMWCKKREWAWCLTARLSTRKSDSIFKYSKRNKINMPGTWYKPPHSLPNPTHRGHKFRPYLIICWVCPEVLHWTRRLELTGWTPNRKESPFSPRETASVESIRMRLLGGCVHVKHFPLCELIFMLKCQKCAMHFFKWKRKKY